MKKEKTIEADENSEINSIGQMLNISSDDIRTTMNKKKILLITGLVIIVVSVLAGCIDPNPGPGHYMAVGIYDFSWVWRWI